MNLYEYSISGLDLRNKIILDCAIGAAESTAYWAKEIEKQGGTSKIIGYDLDLSPDDINLINRNLGNLKKYVELRNKDISNLDDIECNSIDFINCDDTIVFLASDFNTINNTLLEFYRVLKKNGILVINTEIPIEQPKTDYELNQYRRWNLAKAVFAFHNEIWSIEPHQNEIDVVLNRCGFTIIERKQFPPSKQSNPVNVIHEWEEIMIKKVKTLFCSDRMREALLSEILDIKENVLKNGLASPGYYSLKASK